MSGCCPTLSALTSSRRWTCPRPPSPAALSSACTPPSPSRHTSRYPFADTPIPTPVREDLREAARLEGAALDFPGPWHVRFLLDLVEDAEGLDMMDPDRLAEVEQWTRIGAETAADDGVPEYAFGPRRRSGRAPVRDFAGRRHPADLGTTDFEEKPQLALLGTETDRPGDWLRAGQALQRVLLRATNHELVCSLTTQALEWRDLRWAAREPLSTMAHVHLTLRLGYGPVGPTNPHAARAGGTGLRMSPPSGTQRGTPGRRRPPVGQVIAHRLHAARTRLLDV